VGSYCNCAVIKRYVLEPLGNKVTGKVPEWLMGMTRNHMASAA
jgi:hypothetical protein